MINTESVTEVIVVVHPQTSRTIGPTMASATLTKLEDLAVPIWSSVLEPEMGSRHPAYVHLDKFTLTAQNYVINPTAKAPVLGMSGLLLLVMVSTISDRLKTVFAGRASSWISRLTPVSVNQDMRTNLVRVFASHQVWNSYFHYPILHHRRKEKEDEQFIDGGNDSFRLSLHKFFVERSERYVNN